MADTLSFLWREAISVGQIARRGVIGRAKVGAVRLEAPPGAAGEDLETALSQPQIPDNPGMDRVNRVGTRGEAEARPQLFGDGRAADVGKALEHHDPQAGSSQIAGGDQAVMPGAHDNDIRIHSASPRSCRRRQMRS